jgi:hypothetical protein
VAETVVVKVSVASLMQTFHGCEPEYIRTVCKARCCDAPGRPSGTMISIHPTEVPVIVRRGGRVEGGLLVTPERVCTFKDTETYLCTLHTTPDKPFGCIASPFTLNKAGTLIIRNRYRLLPCYRPAGREIPGPRRPAYIAFEASLRRIFGPEGADGLILAAIRADEDCERFFNWPMPKASYDMLMDNDATKRAAH